VSEIADVFQAGCDAAAITHGHPSGWLAAGAFAQLVSELAQGVALEDALSAVERELARWPEAEECLEALARARREAGRGAPSPEAVERVGAGWVAEEALAVAVYCLAVDADPLRALLLSVNHGGDSDSTGALCGNLLGAVHGEGIREFVPKHWLGALELRGAIERTAEELVQVRRLVAREP